MTDTSTDGIHRFWVAAATKYGCSECQMAGDSPDDIDHDDECSVDTDIDRCDGGANDE